MFFYANFILSIFPLLFTNPMRIDSVVHLLKKISADLKSGHPLENVIQRENLHAHFHPEAEIRSEVIILAGKGGKLSRKEKEEWLPFVHQMLSGFKGTVISGGTSSGIPGLAGEIALDLLKQGKKAFNLTGYLPENLPDGIMRSSGYDQFLTSTAKDFSLEDVLNYWVDILLHGIYPEKVQLIGIGGGSLAYSEYRLALELGAKVTFLRDSGGSVRKILEDPFWSGFTHFLSGDLSVSRKESDIIGYFEERPGETC